MDILGIDHEYKKDTRQGKCNLSVGCLFNENGEFYHYPSIKNAIKRCGESNIRLGGYENERGNNELHMHLKNLLLDPQDHNAFSISLTAGGTHALDCAMKFLRKHAIECVALGDPGFPRHTGTIQSVISSPFSPLKIQHKYNEYLKFIDAESETPRALLLQGNGHNPTGKDLTIEEWTSLIEKIQIKQKKGIKIIPILDSAYRGLAASPQECNALIQRFSKLEHCIITFSFSKITSLYGRRGGAILVKGFEGNEANEKSLKLRNAESIVHASTPINSVLLDILKNDKQQRLEEIKFQHNLLIQFRQALIEIVQKKGGSDEIIRKITGSGMFCRLGRTDDQVESCYTNNALYLAPGGRINFSGLHTIEQINKLAKVIIENQNNKV